MHMDVVMLMIIWCLRIHRRIMSRNISWPVVVQLVKRAIERLPLISRGLPVPDDLERESPDSDFL